MISVPHHLARMETFAAAAQTSGRGKDKNLGMNKCPVCNRTLWPFQDIALDITFGKIIHMHTKCKGTAGYV